MYTRIELYELWAANVFDVRKRAAWASTTIPILCGCIWYICAKDPTYFEWCSLHCFSIDFLLKDGEYTHHRVAHHCRRCCPICMFYCSDSHTIVCMANVTCRVLNYTARLVYLGGKSLSCDSLLSVFVVLCFGVICVCTCLCACVWAWTSFAIFYLLYVS